MKSRITLHFLLLLSVTLTSCEVFRTTPANPSGQRGTSSRPANGTARDRNSERPTLLGKISEKKAAPKTNAKNTASRKPATISSRPVNSANNGPGRNTTNARVESRPSEYRTASHKKETSISRSAGRNNVIPDVVEIARTYTGTPYRSGGNGRDGIDCSGLICQVYTELGIKVPRVSWQQSEFGKEVEQLKDIKPGDWIFFVPEGGKEGYVSHSGIVTEVRGEKDIVFIHASSSRGVVEDNLFSNYFRNRFVKAVRPF